MYRVIAVGGKIIATTEERAIAMKIASNFSNENCTYCKVYCSNTLIAIFH